MDLSQAREFNNHFILGEMINDLAQFQTLHPDVDFQILKDWLSDVQSHNVSPEMTIRKLLRIFMKTHTFQERFNPLDESTKSKIKAFTNGKTARDVAAGNGFQPKPSPSSQLRFRNLDYGNSIHKSLWEKFSNWIGISVQKHERQKSPFTAPKDLKLRRKLFSNVWGGGEKVVYEDSAKTKVMEVYQNVEFENWGLVDEVKCIPALTCVPTKVLGLQNLIKHVIKFHPEMRVRCSGYRHSWSPIFSEQKEILVSMINLQQATKLPDPEVILPNSTKNANNDFKTIEVISEGAASAQIRVGAAVTTEEFRRWAVSYGKWTLPMDVILGEVTIGGTNGSICHGAGRRHQTLNDQVQAIEYIDLTGTHQKVSEKAHLLAAAGCFGLLGIVTHITYELAPMSYAVMNPKKTPIGLAIPPPNNDPNNIPSALRKPYTQSQFADAVVDFESRATNDYYAEWFWFAYQSTAWVNTWPVPTADPTGSRDYTSPEETFLQWVQTWLGGVVTSTALYRAIPGRWQAQLLASVTMALLPPTTFDSEKDGPIKTMLPNALHFRRDDQNMRVRDMELEIPIPMLKDGSGKPDWMVVRQAWWDVIGLVYSENNSPMRLCMELRIMGDSDLIMAPQRGNGECGTASIEVLTIPDAVSDGEWNGFVQRVCDKWMGSKESPRNGNVRPHWGKEWATTNMKMRGLPAREYLKRRAYNDAIPEFKKALGEIGKMHGWAPDGDLGALQKRFSNPLWDSLIFLE